LMLGKKSGMGQRSLGQPIIPLKLVQARFFTLVVDQVKELLLTLRWPSVSGKTSKNKTNGQDGEEDSSRHLIR
jgi:hypothetical protein